MKVCDEIVDELRRRGIAMLSPLAGESVCGVSSTALVYSAIRAAVLTQEVRKCQCRVSIARQGALYSSWWAVPTLLSVRRREQVLEIFAGRLLFC